MELPLDQLIGSLLENWLTRDTGNRCRFCNLELGDPREPGDRFCSARCKEDFNKVFEARLAIGKRDLDQRGFD